MGTVHVAWSDGGDIAGTGTDVDIFAARFPGGAIEAVSDVESNALATEASASPSLVVRGGRRFFVWDDRSDFDGDQIADADVLYRVR